MTPLLKQALIPLLAVLLAACGSDKPSGPVQLKGAGATFPQPAYSKWIKEYTQDRSTVKIAYEPVGSAAGVEQLAAGQVDFAGSDMPLTDDQLAKFKTKPFHFPTLVGAVVPIYNVNGISTELNFNADVLAGIYLGKIKSWSDPAIKKINPDVALTSTPIKVIHRAEGSGTTHLLTDYLAKSSPAWKAAVGEGTSVKWPVGEALPSNEAVAEAVKKTPGAIGYVELNYAIQQKIAHGKVQNSSGKFMQANFESLGSALDTEQNTPADLRIIATNASGPNAYPIASYTYLLVPQKFDEVPKRDAMKRFLEWVFTDGQKSALSLDYNVLTPNILEKVRVRVDRIQ